MPVRVCNVSDLAPRIRGRKSAVIHLPEYLEAKTKLADGLKRFEAIEISLKPSTEKGMKSILQTFKRTVESDLKRLNLTDYVVSAYKSPDGQNIITIANEPQPVAEKTESKKKTASR